jgi:hypothetical protein
MIGRRLSSRASLMSPSPRLNAAYNVGRRQVPLMLSVSRWRVESPSCRWWNEWHPFERLHIVASR